MRRKETQGDGNTLLSKPLANGWGQRGEGPSQKGPQRGEHPPGGPWKKEASQHLRSLGEKKSVPVVPVFQLISRHPHFSLIIYNYLITN